MGIPTADLSRVDHLSCQRVRLIDLRRDDYPTTLDTEVTHCRLDAQLDARPQGLGHYTPNTGWTTIIQGLFGTMWRLEHTGIAGHLHACKLFHVVAAVARMDFGDRKTWATDSRQQD
jgi:hypothetical protein